MGKYTGEVCPACNQIFTDEDDVVVCPVCGTPHHRECWFKTGRCTFQDRHGSFTWTPDNAKKGQEDFNAKSTLGEICPNCGANNPPDTLFCPTCGMPRNVSGTETQFSNPYVRFDDPFKGVTIDGVSSKDMAEFIQGSSYEYIRKFSQKKHNGFNWAAFIFGPLWFLYRKMYKIGGALLLIIAIIAITFSGPINDFTENYNTVMEKAYSAQTDEEADAAIAELEQIYMSSDAVYLQVFSGIMFALFLGCGVSGNTVYRKYCVKSIKEAEFSAHEGAQREFYKTMNLRKKGGVNVFAPIIGIFSYEILMTLVSLLVSSIIGL